MPQAQRSQSWLRSAWSSSVNSAELQLAAPGASQPQPLLHEWLQDDVASEDDAELSAWHSHAIETLEPSNLAGDTRGGAERHASSGGSDTLRATREELELVCTKMDHDMSDSINVRSFLSSILEVRQPALRPAEAAVLRVFLGPLPWRSHSGLQRSRLHQRDQRHQQARSPGGPLHCSDEDERFAA